jgi:hypothetical protein
MTNKILTIAVIALIAAAFGLGYAIYMQRSGGSSDTSFENRFNNLQQGEILPAPEAQEYEGEESPLINLLPSAEELGIMEEERVALAHPAKDAPAEEKQRHLELVQKVAKEAQYLDITKCTIATPVVLKVKYKEEIFVKNSDNVPHTIVFDAENTISIPANSTTNITPGFEHGPGTYGYGCDQTPHAAGLFLVTY